MKQARVFRAGAIIILLTVAAALAGCGGGGGGTPAPAYSNLRMTVELPRTASSLSSISALVSILSYDAEGVATKVVADTAVALTYNATTCTYSGSFTVKSIPVGTNYIAKVTVTGAYAETSVPPPTYPRVAASVYTAYLGAVVPSIQDGVTADVAIGATSTVKTIAAIGYGVSEGLASKDVTASAYSAISSAVDSLLAAQSIIPYYFMSGSYGDPFDPTTWTTNTMLQQQVNTILVAASLLDLTAPTVSAFTPASNATGVAYDATQFKVKFSESMDSTINLNTQSVLTASGFSITVQKYDTGTYLTITYANALSYGAFSWATTTNANDTLVFTLSSSAPKTLSPNTMYTITDWTVPSNIVDLGGNAVSTTTIPTSGSFTTASETTPPTVSSFLPASGATGVAYDGTVFKVIFSESMDNTVDLNNSSTLIASGFSITLQKQSTGTSVTINADGSSGAEPALSYGVFAWETTNAANDTLSYTLNSSSMLIGSGLFTLDPSTVYNITARTVPTNLTDVAGNPLSATGIATTGSFTTAGGI